MTWWSHWRRRRRRNECENACSLESKRHHACDEKCMRYHYLYVGKKILIFELWGTDVLSSSGSISFSQFGQRREKKERIPGSDSARPHVNFCAFSFLFFFGATHYFFPFQTKHSLDRGIKMSSPWIDGNMEEQKWHRHFHFLRRPHKFIFWAAKKIRFLMPLIDTCGKVWVGEFLFKKRKIRII